MIQKCLNIFVFLCSFFVSNSQNNALQLNNSNYITLASVVNNSIYYLNSSTFTIEYDFYLNSLSDFNESLISFDQNDVVAKLFHFYVNNSGVSNLKLGNGLIEETVPDMPTFNLQQWYHEALVVTNTDTKNVKVYMNGVQAVDYNFSVSLEGFSGQTRIILGSPSAASLIDVKYDNFRVWSTARTAIEIADNYNTCLVGNEIGLDWLYSFDGLNGRRLNSLASNSFENRGFILSNDFSYVPRRGCAITPLFAPIATSGSYNGIFYYAGQFKGKPFFKNESINLDFNALTSEARCADNPTILSIIWQNNQWELVSDGCVWELGEACVSLFDSNPAFNLKAVNSADTPFPPCDGWVFDGSFNVTFSSLDCDALSVNSNELEDSLMVYPNPTKGFVNIQTLETVSVEVYDMIGKLILSKQIENEFQNLDLTNFPTGIYLLKATNTNGFTQTHKIIKE
jgi:hypothetical protein